MSAHKGGGPGGGGQRAYPQYPVAQERADQIRQRNEDRDRETDGDDGNSKSRAKQKQQSGDRGPARARGRDLDRTHADDWRRRREG